MEKIEILAGKVRNLIEAGYAKKRNTPNTPPNNIAAYSSKERPATFDFTVESHSPDLLPKDNSKLRITAHYTMELADTFDLANGKQANDFVEDRLGHVLEELAKASGLDYRGVDASYVASAADKLGYLSAVEGTYLLGRHYTAKSEPIEGRAPATKHISSYTYRITFNDSDLNKLIATAERLEAELGTGSAVDPSRFRDSGVSNIQPASAPSEEAIFRI